VPSNNPQRLSKAQILEMAYQETVRNAEFIVKDEGARRLRLRILLLENENDDLHEQLALRDDRVDVLEQESEELRGKLSQAQEDIVQKQAELRTQARELQNLKVSRSPSDAHRWLTSFRPNWLR